MNTKKNEVKMKLYYFIYENGMTLKTFISSDKEKIKLEYNQLNFSCKYENSKKINDIVEIESENINII